jgi:hypothetical protein
LRQQQQKQRRRNAVKEQGLFRVELQRLTSAHEAVREIELKINELCIGGWTIMGAHYCTGGVLELGATREAHCPPVVDPGFVAFLKQHDPIQAEAEAAVRNEELARQARESGACQC